MIIQDSSGKYVCSEGEDHKVIVSIPPSLEGSYCHTCVLIKKENAPACPICGTKKGFAMGTGDCGCLG